MYRTGFIGATTNEASAWVGNQVGDAKKIVVPFAGTGKDIQAMCNNETSIESWDTQRYSRCIIDGVFAAKEAESNVDKIRYRKGYMYESRAIKYIDERSAGFFDWVSKYGTDFDKASLVSATVRSTLIGRMTQWHASPEQFFQRFMKARKYNEDWVNQPGEFIHHEGSFFDSIPTGSYDFMQVDPPKIVVGSDVYSANFNSLQEGLGGEKLPKWNWRDVMGHFRALMEVDADRVLFMYVSGVRPPYEEVLAMLEEFGSVEKIEEFPHKSRTDYGIIIKKG